MANIDEICSDLFLVGSNKDNILGEIWIIVTTCNIKWQTEFHSLLFRTVKCTQKFQSSFLWLNLNFEWATESAFRALYAICDRVLNDLNISTQNNQESESQLDNGSATHESYSSSSQQRTITSPKISKPINNTPDLTTPNANQNNQDLQSDDGSSTNDIGIEFPHEMKPSIINSNMSNPINDILDSAIPKIVNQNNQDSQSGDENAKSGIGIEFLHEMKSNIANSNISTPINDTSDFATQHIAKVRRKEIPVLPSKKAGTFKCGYKKCKFTCCVCGQLFVSKRNFTKHRNTIHWDLPNVEVEAEKYKRAQNTLLNKNII